MRFIKFRAWKKREVETSFLHDLKPVNIDNGDSFCCNETEYILIKITDIIQVQSLNWKIKLNYTNRK